MFWVESWKNGMAWSGTASNVEIPISLLKYSEFIRRIEFSNYAIYSCRLLFYRFLSEPVTNKLNVNSISVVSAMCWCMNVSMWSGWKSMAAIFSQGIRTINVDRIFCTKFDWTKTKSCMYMLVQWHMFTFLETLLSCNSMLWRVCVFARAERVWCVHLWRMNCSINWSNRKILPCWVWVTLEFNL